MPLRILVLPAATAACLVACCFDVHAQPRYTLTDLGTLGGQYTTARDMNDNGVIAGEAHRTLSNVNAFTYQNGTLHEINPVHYRQSVTAINNRGEIIGSFEPVYSVTPQRRPFHYVDGVFTDLTSALDPDVYLSGINDRGQIVGTARPRPDLPQGFIYENGVVDYLGAGLSGVPNYAYDINDSGTVVGSVADQDVMRPFVFKEGRLTTVNVRGEGLKVNVSDVLLGYFHINFGAENSQFRPFLFADGVFTDLGTLGGRFGTPNDLNDLGQVVGNSVVLNDIGEPGGHHAFLYTDGAMYDLNDLVGDNSEWELVSATAINNDGLITGYGWHLPSGQQRSFLLTPVPEPQTILLCGAALLGRRNRRGRSRVAQA